MSCPDPEKRLAVTVQHRPPRSSNQNRVGRSITITGGPEDIDEAIEIIQRALNHVPSGRRLAGVNPKEATDE